MPRTTSRARAEAHEALVLRVVALRDQVAALALRHPGAAVPAETRAIAEALLFDAAPFTRPYVPSPRLRGEGGAAKALGRDPRGRVRGFPAAAGVNAALASQLGQAMAALEMWEAEHSHWDGECFVWRLTRGEPPLPIQRLRARAKTAVTDPAREREGRHMREELLRRIAARYHAGYDQGYADAQKGLPPDSDRISPRPGAGD